MRSRFIFGAIAGVAFLTLAFRATGAEPARRNPTPSPDFSGNLSPKTKPAPTGERRRETIIIDRSVASLLFQASAAQLSKDYDRAIALLTRALRANSDKAMAYIIYAYRGLAYYRKGELTKALSDYTVAIQLSPTIAITYVDRGNVYRDLGDNNKAINDYTAAIKLNPKDADGYEARSGAYLKKGNYRKALSDCEQALRLSPNNDLALNRLAWLKATCPEASLRNGKEAARVANRACDLTKWKNWTYLDTLAAAYAEAGDFESAVKFQAQAIELGPASDDRRAGMHKRLELYRKKKPYREDISSTKQIISS
jgi:tetratricopeptide (TPR) repeat protein